MNEPMLALAPLLIVALWALLTPLAGRGLTRAPESWHRAVALAGLGLATAEALLAEGAHVVIGSRSPQATADRLGVLGVPLDLGDPASAQALVDAALDRRLSTRLPVEQRR